MIEWLLLIFIAGGTADAGSRPGLYMVEHPTRFAESDFQRCAELAKAPFGPSAQAPIGKMFPEKANLLSASGMCVRVEKGPRVDAFKMHAYVVHQKDGAKDGTMIHQVIPAPFSNLENCTGGVSNSTAPTAANIQVALTCEKSR